MEGAQQELRLTLRRALVGTLASALVLCTTALPGQGRPEFRIDGIFAENAAIQLGAGMLFPLGTYLRSGFIAGAGLSNSRASFRGDFVNLFHVDPFRESRWAPYGGGGFSLRRDNATDESGGFLLLVVGVEGPLGKGYSPAFEVGLGGGMRAGVILRQSSERTR